VCCPANKYNANEHDAGNPSQDAVVGTVEVQHTPQEQEHEQEKPVMSQVECASSTPASPEKRSRKKKVRRRAGVVGFSVHEIAELEALSPARLQDYLIRECGVEPQFLQEEVPADSQELVAFAQTMQYDLRPILGLVLVSTDHAGLVLLEESQGNAADDIGEDNDNGEDIVEDHDENVIAHCKKSSAQDLQEMGVDLQSLGIDDLIVPPSAVAVESPAITVEQYRHGGDEGGGGGDGGEGDGGYGSDDYYDDLINACPMLPDAVESAAVEGTTISYRTRSYCTNTFLTVLVHTVQMPRLLASRISLCMK
jgi:hypothetical protein